MVWWLEKIFHHLGPRTHTKVLGNRVRTVARFPPPKLRIEETVHKPIPLISQWLQYVDGRNRRRRKTSPSTYPDNRVLGSKHYNPNGSSHLTHEYLGAWTLSTFGVVYNMTYMFLACPT